MDSTTATSFRWLFAAAVGIASHTAAAWVDNHANGFTPPTPFPVPLSANGPDQFQSVAAGPSGSFYVAGFAAQTIISQRFVVLTRIRANGTVDTSFGLAGVAVTSLVFTGGNDEIDLVVQNGKPVVSLTIDNAVDANDRDVAVARFNANGSPDTTFGVGGVRVLDLATGFNNGSTIVARDASRGLALGSDGSLFIHAAQRNTTLSTNLDTDFAIVKLTPNGNVDLAWGNSGRFRLDIEQSGATPRGLVVLANNAVIALGYSNTAFVGNTVQPVLYKLTPGGLLDTTFGVGGVFHEAVLSIQTEVWGGVVVGNNLITSGYGRQSGAVNSFLSMRFSALTGARDTTWGGAANGVVLVDPSGVGMGNNARNLVGLPGGRSMVIGSTGPANSPMQDAAWVIHAADGSVVPVAEGGIQTFVFGTNGNDQFWGGAYNAGKALLVGYKGSGAVQTETQNDDAYAVLLDVPGDVLFINGFDG